MPPICHIIPCLSDRPFFDFLLFLRGFNVLGVRFVLLSFFFLRDYASEPDLDGSVEKKFILEVNLLFEGKAADVDV